MEVLGLDHYNVSTVDAERSARFYVDVLGFRIGDRPPFPFPGAWVYCGDRPVLHLVEKESIPEGTGRVDHIAFQASGYAEAKVRLDTHDVRYREMTVPGSGLTQIFLETPDSLWLELIFQPDDVARGAA